MAQFDEQKRVLEHWLQLPESRRRDATDVVAFAYRLLQERPELVGDNRETSLETIVSWLMPHLHDAHPRVPATDWRK
ncbi:MAG: hypothetical protein ACJ8OJ_16730 [Povalibacter sp.]|jgi:hypothetical protein